MKIETLFSSIDVVSLLLFLSSDNFITSSIIREKFNNIKEKTLYKWLEDFVDAKILEKNVKIPKKAGGDKAEYKMTSKGVKIRDQLIERYIKTLKPTIEQMIEERANKDKKSL